MKIIEFGSEFDLRANDGFTLINNNNFFKKKNVQKFRSGRDALKAIAINFKNKTNKVLLPALCCESMVLPFVMNGYNVVFYKLNPDYTANVEYIETKLEKGCIFLYMSYFGIQPFDLTQLEKWRKQYGVTFVEDRTHNALHNLEESGFVPDLTMLSIRKWIAVLDGGLLWGKDRISANIITDSRFSDIREQAMLKKSLYLENGDESLKGEYLSDLSRASLVLDETNIPSTMTNRSIQIIQKLDLDKILSQRIKNVNELQVGLRKLEKSGEISFITKTPQESTLYFPILVKARDLLQKKLAQQKIYCPVIWPVPKQAVGVCEVADYTAKHMLAIPCDQRYDIKDMRYIADTICCLMHK